MIQLPNMLNKWARQKFLIDIDNFSFSLNNLQNVLCLVKVWYILFIFSFIFYILSLNCIKLKYQISSLIRGLNFFF